MGKQCWDLGNAITYLRHRGCHAVAETPGVVPAGKRGAATRVRAGLTRAERAERGGGGRAVDGGLRVRTGDRGKQREDRERDTCQGISQSRGTGVASGGNARAHFGARLDEIVAGRVVRVSRTHQSASLGQSRRGRARAR